MRHYFFSYFFWDRKKNSGYGQMSINRPGLIRSSDDLEGIRECIKQQNKFKEVVILNWQRYEEPRALIGGAQ